MSTNERAVSLQSEVERILPDFVKAMRDGGSDVLVLHQDAFAADYQEDEIRLLGLAIKYAGIFGKTVQIIGRNRETLTKKS